MLPLLDASFAKKAALFSAFAVSGALAYKVIQREICKAELRAKIERRQIEREKCMERIQANLELTDQNQLAELLKLDVASLTGRVSILENVLLYPSQREI